MTSTCCRLRKHVCNSYLFNERIKSSSLDSYWNMIRHFSNFSDSIRAHEDARSSQSDIRDYRNNNQYEAPPPGPIHNKPSRGRQQFQRFPRSNGLNFGGERARGGQSDESFLEKFKLSFDKRDKPASTTTHLPLGENQAQMENEGQPPLPEDADAIFKKMKETGLIPNAVAMLDGLCKDGLVQEAMKLFGLMREKGTMPEVVIYTAVVEGFCKAQKFDDAKRIFRKMQNNGITPNAFSYTVLIQGLYRCNRLDDALEFCEEMVEAGHSPNVTTFVGLVSGVCKEKGVEEAQNVIGRLHQKGFFINEKAVREFMEKKAPFSSAVWEAIYGKKPSNKSF